MKSIVGWRVCMLLVCLGVAGCQPKEITALQRKQAASLESEAKFALSLREIERAEGLYAQAAALCPDNADYWMTLAACRKRLNRPADAKKAFESALAARKEAYARDPRNSRELMEQVYVLALLGRIDDARKLIDKAHANHGNEANVRGFTHESLDKLMKETSFKELAL